MKKSVVQIGIGLLPILLGFGSPLLFALPIPFFLTNLIFFAFWFWLCFRFCDPAKALPPQFLRVCLPGALILVPGVLQDLVPSIGLPSIITTASNFYFFSGIQLAGRILTPFLQTITAWPYMILDYLLLMLICILCMVLKKKVA